MKKTHIHKCFAHIKITSLLLLMFVSLNFAQYQEFKENLANHFFENNTEFSVRYYQDTKPFIMELASIVKDVVEAAEIRGIFLASMEYSVQYSSNRAKVDFKVTYLETAQNIFNSREKLIDFISQKLLEKKEIFFAGLRFESERSGQSLANEIFKEANSIAENSARRVIVSSYGCDITTYETYVNFEFSVGYYSESEFDHLSVFNQNELDSVVLKNLTLRVNDFIVHFLGNVSGELIDPMKSYERAGSLDEYLEHSIRSMTFQNTTFGKSKLVRFNFEYYASYEQEQFIESETDSILAKIIHPDMNEHEKERAIHDYLVLNIAYDDSEQYGSAYDALTINKAVCHGYTLLAYKLFEKVGIKSLIIDSPDMKHTWNLVFIDSSWYHLDITWDDPIPDVEGRIRYDYYNLSDREIMYLKNKKHYWNRRLYPEASSEYSYIFN